MSKPHLPLRVEIFPADDMPGVWIARSIEWDVFGHGPTHEAAIEMLRQAICAVLTFEVVDDKALAVEARRQSAIIAAAAADPNSDEAQMTRELEAHHAELMKGEPDYDWGPKGPPK